MIPIKYLVGDATVPTGAGPKIIAHVCNDVGAWGAGFVMALSGRWKAPEDTYLRICASYQQDGGRFPAMGTVHLVSVEPDIVVANMIAQDGVWRRGGKPPINYQGLTDALIIVQREATRSSATVHMPRIGCGLAGGKWKVVEELINETLCKMDVPVYVYDLPLKEAA